MKLFRYRKYDQVLPGLLDDQGIARCLSDIVSDIADENLTEDAVAGLKKIDMQTLPVIDGDIDYAPCVGNVGKCICIGLNYADHAAEAGMDIPDEPIVFFKATSSLCGANDDVMLPPGSEKSDWEVELGVVIGKEARYLDAADALDYVAGYCVVNDLSERSYQLERGGQWVKGKSCDTFGPIGPWLVTKDEVPDPQNLGMWLEVDGNRYQSGSTKTMIFDVAAVVSHLSQFMSLQPGDVISTGTPPGVGMGQKPDPVYLRAGQEIELGIDGLGRQKQQVVHTPIH